MSYDPGKVFTSIQKWYNDGDANDETPTEFKTEQDEQAFVFAIEEIFRLCLVYEATFLEKIIGENQ